MQKKCVPYGSDVSAGKFKCVDCGNEISMGSKSSLPPCSKFSASPHPKRCWSVLSGNGDSPRDPYPTK